MEISTQELSSPRALLARKCGPAVVAGLLATGLAWLAGPVMAGEAAVANVAIVQADAGRLLTRNELKRMTRESAGRAPVAARQVPLRPTMSQGAYEAAKAAALSLSPDVGKPPQGAQGGAGQGSAPGLMAAPSVLGINILGVDQTTAGGWYPPDTHGAAGKYHYCQVVTSYIRCYQKGGTSAVVLSASLASFFGYATQDIFAPRIVYDATWDRFVVYAEADPESPSVQKIFFAVSKGASALSGWWIYSINVTKTAGDFWDFGGLGMDQDAVIITANNFNGATWVDSRLITIAKAQFYNGRAVAIPFLTGLSGTLQPPIVLDQDARSYVVAAEDSVTGTIRKYTLQNTSHPYDVSIANSPISVSPWGLPPDASQPGTTDKIDTGDGRFQNASTQNAGMIWQTHTVSAASYPMPRWYKLDAVTDTVVSSAGFYVYEASHDFNPSIAANAAGDVFVTWVMTCPTALGCPNGTKNAQMRFSGKRVADPALLGNNLTGAYGISSSPTSGFSFGHYSAVSIDPVDPSRAWVTNEFLTGPLNWGSRIARIGY